METAYLMLGPWLWLKMNGTINGVTLDDFRSFSKLTFKFES